MRSASTKTAPLDALTRTCQGLRDSFENLTTTGESNFCSHTETPQRRQTISDYLGKTLWDLNSKRHNSSAFLKFPVFKRVWTFCLSFWSLFRILSQDVLPSTGHLWLLIVHNAAVQHFVLLATCSDPGIESDRTKLHQRFDCWVLLCWVSENCEQ